MQSYSTHEFVSKHHQDLAHIATAARVLGMDAVLKAKSGHVGLPLGGAEMGTLLYFGLMHHNPSQPLWPDRDRFVLSAGHGSMLQYSLLHLAGYDLPKEEIVNFRQLGSATPGHPEYGHTPGVEVTTGPLGQGIANAVGMALAERMLAARLNCEQFTVVDHNTYVILGDGCMMEGVSAEASSVAGHLKLGKLIALYDANNITIDGTIDISFGEDVAKRYEAYGWNVLHADGNDFASLAKALDTAAGFSKASAAAPGSTGPTLIVCRGIAGKGSPKWEGKPKIHGNPMTAEDVVDAKKHLGLADTTPFALPAEALAAARSLMEGRSQKFTTWSKTVEAAKAYWKTAAPEKLAFFEEALEGKQTGRPALPIDAWAAAKGKMATRVASGKALSAAAKHNALLVGGSADLAGSNNTTLEGTTFVSAKEFHGRNIHFGVREHGMGALVNGMALHGGLRPYCATFAVFSDYMRPAVRLAALMKIPSLFVFTHDSYAVGEDGPTHQPVEHAASLRSIPNLNVFRPADAMETFAAWQTALEDTQTPTAFLLTRQDLPDLDEVLQEALKTSTPSTQHSPADAQGSVSRTPDTVLDGMRQGGYLLKDFGNPAASVRLCVVASGSEVALALRTACALEAGTFHTLSGETVRLAVRVVSAPAPQLLAKNPVTLNALLPAHLPLVAVEAGAPQGWGEIVGRQGAIFAMKGFGASAPAAKLDAHFGFVPEEFSKFIQNYLSVRP